ncbi:hypothetical protein [Demequina lignilytica]|uniref:Septum formation-related domain-containing protein n=1 Tax=Demequina lignilytica TaxID=3051663 RepID=A0AB35MG37_9MICO|nr:hypothetical protein [Demequina sp. SYSU T0a273]MDN4482736.1 hypothetical protein [Demequina sp. SYSU T0a273]
MRRIVPILGALAAATLLAGCSADDQGAVDAALAWDGAAAGVAELQCADLQTDWSEDATTRPERCWTFEESDGLPGAFAAITTSFSEAVGSEPTFGPSCAAWTETQRSLGCQARWTVGDTTALLTSGLTLEWLGSMVEEDPAADILDPTLTATHELTLWIGGEELEEGLDQAELFYTDPAA